MGDRGKAIKPTLLPDIEDLRKILTAEQFATLMRCRPMPRAKYSSCPACELLCPMHQRTCGACSREQSDDVGRLDVR